MTIDPAMLLVLKAWRHETEFCWHQRLNLCKPGEPRALVLVLSVGLAGVPQAGSGCGDRQFGTHAIRHSHRSWLDTEATAIAVQ